LICQAAQGGLRLPPTDACSLGQAFDGCGQFRLALQAAEQISGEFELGSAQPGNVMGDQVLQVPH
jgi:hypothetical protein